MEHEQTLTRTYGGPTGPLECIYYMAKPGEARRYAASTPYSKEFAAAQKADGFRIFRIMFQLPKGWDSAQFAIGGMVQDVTEEQ